MSNPHLLYEFRNEAGEIEPLFFSEPVSIFETAVLAEVPTIMDKVEKAVGDGFYAAGYVSYEAAPAFHPEMRVQSQGEMPLVWFGIFNEPQQYAPVEELQTYAVSEWNMTSSIDHYKTGIQQIKQAIERGDTYQVNYTERLSAKFTGNDLAFYRQLARNQQADYGAYLNLGRFRVLSASPELFFKVQGGKITAKPMKGTASRGRTTHEDNEHVKALVSSEKEQAENLMIVDLLRNDMSRLAKKGTVKTEALFTVETYPTVHQLTSTVQAELDETATILNWFQALFPCGSITGAPKISTMKYIADLEQTPREVYCGAIGFITPEKQAVFNVPIRTVVIDRERDTARFGVGGGITWDSTSEGEFQELHTKAQVLTAKRPVFHLLESLKLEDGNYPLLPYHLARLKDSAEYFHFPGNIQKIESELGRLAEKHAVGLYKIRLLVDKDGQIELQAQNIIPIAQPVKCIWAPRAVDSRDPFLFHKTTHRDVYEQASGKLPEGIFSTILWNEQQQITEFTIGNAVLEKNGKFFTPPVSCGLLAGTFRQQLVDRQVIEEKMITKEELADCDALWLVNSVRGWLAVELVNDHDVTSLTL
ncbi:MULTISPECIES: aminodeoxychorismate synthase component I [Planococcus]|uniref:Aminodeoxychorismate synthase, component I n=1 Tax=Planococcus faecalis TaxID=1598147 RepID=A0ABM6IXM9_9BACL|nr:MULTISPECIES: aminodeoxychorismate synthase component I [Planococcus]AQU80789.1 aminodeoxychorismate synthase, component I [Planococcus faecalis]MDJ0332007.1 aminodeoxychorismate synthase component I [Planococcus sp. S3-L1]OHX55775.1 aminodeoxychorismate synthase, component I [Planococcus faecalis]